MAYLDRIAACNTHNPQGFRPWIVDGERVGEIGPNMAELLARSGADVLAVAPDALTFAGPLASAPAEQRTQALDAMLRRLRDDGVVRGWREEAYPVAPQGQSWPVRRPALQMERAAAPLFGVRSYGVHMNGYVRHDDGSLSMWVARRSRTKDTYPGLLDNAVAGGQPVGLSLADNLVKECAEEADIPEALARTAVPVGLITYRYREPRDDALEAVKPDVQYCFDLELPEGFTPQNTDGEIEDFMLWRLDQVAACVRDTDRFKFNCSLVIIDFLIRHGYLTPESDPDYVRICRGLRA